MTDLEIEICKILDDVHIFCGCDVGKCSGEHLSCNCKVSVARKIITKTAQTEGHTTPTNTGSPKFPSEPELVQHIKTNASHINIDHAQLVYRWLTRQLMASA